ncbi:MAG TPA: hypothetical protein VFG00_01130 [Acidothermaceae bacterium]|nr:hypothetical protein [Acidothermaceae bacterium]
MVAFGWLVVAAVTLGVGVLPASMDRRSRRNGHVLRGSSKISAALVDTTANARVINHTRGRLVAPPARRK